MATVNGTPGFTQLGKLNVKENLLVDGSPVVGTVQTGFLSYSDDVIAVSTDANAPSFLTGLTVLGNTSFSLFDAATGAVRNDTGRVINKLDGTISYHPNKIGGGTALLQIFSEKSTDGGATYSINQGSLRPVEVSNTGESFKTAVSFLADWQPDEIIRFRIFEDNGVTVTLDPSSTTALSGQTITGHSVIWTLAEI
jgi:hypothetical protein